MNATRPPSASLLFGSKEYTDASRALSELQAQRPIRIDTPGEALLVLPVERLDDQRLAEFEELCQPAELRLVLTRQRALALGVKTLTPLSIPVSRMKAAGILELAIEAKIHHTAETRPATQADIAAIALVKLTRGLPSVLAAKPRYHDVDRQPAMVAVKADAIGHFAVEAANRLAVASEASIPLISGVTSRFVVFHDGQVPITSRSLSGRPTSTSR